MGQGCCSVRLPSSLAPPSEPAINSAPAHGDADLAVILLQTERLADALAEGELRDMGLDEEAALTALTGLINRLRDG